LVQNFTPVVLQRPLGQLVLPPSVMASGATDEAADVGSPAAVATVAAKTMPAAGEASTASVADDAGVRGQELMPFDDGSMTADKAQSSAMSLVINYAEPIYAAGTAVFGLGLLVLPFLARLNELESRIFSYDRHGEMNRNQKMRLFTESELRTRLGLLDPEVIGEDLTRSTEDLDDYMNQSSIDALDAEVTKIQKWRESANTNLKGLQKRSALAFLGLPPDATDGDINKMYKKMALELHPDKGGDPEKFQELQEMKERLTEIEADEKKTDEEKAEEEEAEKKAKEKEEEEEKQKLPPDERVKKLRMEVHDNTVRLWDRAKKSRDEITVDKAKSNAQPALNILRLFVERFVNNEIKMLRHDDAKGAEAKFRKFVRQGAEIISVAAMHDVQSTLQTISMQFNYRLVARSGSPEMHGKCKALLQAISEVPAQSEAFIKRIEDNLAENKEREKRSKEERAKEQKEREAKGDFSGEAQSAAQAKAAPKAAAAAKAPAAAPAPKAASSTAAPPAAGATSAAAAAPDPFGDFDFGPEPRGKAQAQGPQGGKPSSEALVTKKDDDRDAVASAVQQRRTSWDPNFDHPYAGALKGNGQGIFCRPCQRWIQTYEYNVEVFLTHVERVHPKPPPGWSR